MKFRDYLLGLALNNYPCFLCEASKKDIDVGKATNGFKMTRKFLDLKRSSQALMYNPQNKEYSDFCEMAKGPEEFLY